MLQYDRKKTTEIKSMTERWKDREYDNKREEIKSMQEKEKI